MRAPLRILIADDHVVVREGARILVERQPGWEVCGTAADGREAVAQTLAVRPDVVVLDLHMPDLDGLGVVCAIKKQMPAVEFVIFTAEHGERVVEQLFDAGAKSFIRKADAPHLLIDAISAAAEHKPFFTPEVSGVLFAKFLAGGDAKAMGAPLTAREREIVRLLADGRSNKEVADTLGISVRTSETHRAAVMRKLRIDSLAALVRYAIRNRIVEA